MKIRRDGDTPRSKILKNSWPTGDRRPLYPSEFFSCYACKALESVKEGDGLARKKRETLRKEIQKSLKEQLTAKGADIDLFNDQIQDYMALWDLKEQLKDDINENGLRLYYSTANGGEVEKDNPSVKQLPLINKQMLMLLKQLDISTDKVIKDGGDADDDL